MSTINANTNQTLNLAAGSVLSVAAPSGTTGLAVRLSRIPGGVSLADQHFKKGEFHND